MNLQNESLYHKEIHKVLVIVLLGNWSPKRNELAHVDLPGWEIKKKKLNGFRAKTDLF